jgi:hypothetical protein
MTSPKRVIPEVNMIVSWSKGFLFIFWYHKFGEIFQKNRKTVEFLVEITHFPKRGKTQQKFVDKKITNFIIKNYRSYRWITRTLYKWPFVVVTLSFASPYATKISTITFVHVITWNWIMGIISRIMAFKFCNHIVSNQRLNNNLIIKK